MEAQSTNNCAVCFSICSDLMLPVLRYCSYRKQNNIKIDNTKLKLIISQLIFNKMSSIGFDLIKNSEDISMYPSLWDQNQCSTMFKYVVFQSLAPQQTVVTLKIKL